MELRHLRYFIAVAEEGSVTRAARRLNMQQPPLSQQIAALEDELGVKLFDRVARRIQLNGAGRQFLADARETLALAGSAVQRVRRFDRGEMGHVAAGFTSSASLHRLTPRMIRAFHAEFPRATLDVKEHETFELLQAVDQKHLDVALVRTGQDRFPGLVSHVLHEEDFVAVLPRDHPLARQSAPLALADLLGERMVIFRRPDGVGIFDVLMQSFRDAGLQPVIAAEVTRIIAAINLVAAGRGVTLVPESMRVMQIDGIVYRSLSDGALPSTPLVLVRRRDEVSALVSNFVGIARHAAQEAAQEALPVAAQEKRA